MKTLLSELACIFLEVSRTVLPMKHGTLIFVCKFPPPELTNIFLLHYNPHFLLHTISVGTTLWHQVVIHRPAGGGKPIIPKPRHSHTAVIHLQSMYIFGGLGNDGEIFGDTWEFNLGVIYPLTASSSSLSLSLSLYLSISIYLYIIHPSHQRHITGHLCLFTILCVHDIVMGRL